MSGDHGYIKGPLLPVKVCYINVYPPSDVGGVLKKEMTLICGADFQ